MFVNLMFARFYFKKPINWQPFNLTIVFSLILIAFSVFAAFARQEAGGSTFTVRLMNLEAEAKDPFRFNATLRNGSGETQVYALKASVPDGWNALFRAEGSQVAGLKVEDGNTQDISIELKAAPLSTPGKYEIPVTAISDTDTLKLDLEAVVKGNHQVEVKG